MEDREKTLRSLTDLYIYGFYIHSYSIGRYVYEVDESIEKSTGEMMPRKREKIQSKFIIVGDNNPCNLFRRTLQNIVRVIHKEAFLSCVDLSSRKEEVLDSAIREAGFREKELLILAATRMGLNWISDLIVISLNDGEMDENLYFLFKKFLVNQSDTLRERIKEISSRMKYGDIHEDVKMLFLDVWESDGDYFI